MNHVWLLFWWKSEEGIEILASKKWGVGWVYQGYFIQINPRENACSLPPLGKGITDFQSSA
jgi:hypothetical protein